MALGPTQSTFGPGAPFGPIPGPGGSTLLPSSFGPRNTTFGPAFSPRDVLQGERFRTLSYREAFFRCTHHDGKLFDWQGRVNPRPGELSHQPLIGAQLPTQYVPLDMRRPNDPYRLAKLIVSAFTAMVFGEGMFPSLRVQGGGATEDFARALSKAQGLPSVMTRARNIGGSTGTVGISWRFANGTPRAATHRPMHLHVHEWEDFERLVPAHVSKIAIVVRPVVMHDGRRTQMPFWQRRDWTPEADVGFFDEPVDSKVDPLWRVDPDATQEHGDGFCHFVWVKNLEDTDEDSIDGAPDYDALYENFGTLDVLHSVVTRGGILNLDPTVKLRMEPEIVARYGVRKGSDNAIVTGKDGDAAYMELGGQSLEIGDRMVKGRRGHALDVAQCVVPDPDQIAAAGTSSVALKLLYRPMLAQAGLMRKAYGDAIERILEQQIESARRLSSVSEAVPEAIEPAPESGERASIPAVDEAESAAEEPAERVLLLPPRVVEEEERDAGGEPTGAVLIRFEEREPGEGRDVEADWPDYFPPTPADRQTEVATLAAATGGKPSVSHRTAVERTARLLGLDPEEEWRRVSEEEATRAAREGLMFPPSGFEPAAAPAADGPADPLAPIEQGEDAASAGPTAEERLATPGPAQEIRLSPEFVPNGAQISAAVEIVRLVKAGDLPRDAGLGLLEVMFNLSPDAAFKLMGSAGLATAPAAPAPVAPPAV